MPGQEERLVELYKAVNKRSVMNELKHGIYDYRGIKTLSGADFDLDVMDPDTILIEDIAHALSMNCRWAGHIPVFYSVAEHSLYVAAAVSKEHRLAALLHDASEAYILDMPKPFKRFMPDYANIEHELMRVIAHKFGFEYPLHPDVKVADVRTLELEWKWFKSGRPPQISGRAPLDAFNDFMRAYNSLIS